jgi:hypothetical protein
MIALALFCIALLFLKAAWDHGMFAAAVALLVTIPAVALMFGLGVLVH